ncbi:MAG TPA: FAD-dependent oxidoreductase [Gammaproteobacteria bacterium]|nr:FAD-dependent oxidoreductase [Gammaproteobacteria bacterium]
MNKTVETDIAIIGGGITGLWLLNQLRQEGYSVMLLESATLGGEQTHKAQGIIHGGVKYALHGVMTKASESIATMPDVWQSCFRGEGPIDLRDVPVLSHHQYLWTTAALTSRLAGFFASFTLKGNVKSLDHSEFPAIFQHPEFKGQVYSLDEMVIDVHALIRELVKPNQDVIFKIDPVQENQLQFDEHNRLVSFEIHAAPMQPLFLKAKKYIFAAGAGNGVILKKLTGQSVDMQLRPLHMVIAKHDFSDEVYAHCVGLGMTPRVTITTHRTADGKYAWYIGGQLAEEGVKRDAAEQIALARQELQELFPWLDFSNVEFATFMVSRAEAMQPGGKRPDSCHVEEIENHIVTWPTKLAFAPLLAERVIQCLQGENIKTDKPDMREMRAWPMPAFARPMWDQLL